MTAQERIYQRLVNRPAGESLQEALQAALVAEGFTPDLPTEFGSVIEATTVRYWWPKQNWVLVGKTWLRADGKVSAVSADFHADWRLIRDGIGPDPADVLKPFEELRHEWGDRSLPDESAFDMFCELGAALAEARRIAGVGGAE